MIVFDASTLEGAAIGRGSVPDRAMHHVFAADQVAMSEATMAELPDVLTRPRLAWFISPLDTCGALVVPTQRVTNCRDPEDNKYLELAFAGADTIVSSDQDLLVLHP